MRCIYHMLLSSVCTFFLFYLNRIFFLMFHYQSFSNNERDFTRGVLRCKFVIADVGSSSTTANTDFVFNVLLGRGEDSAYTDLWCRFTVILFTGAFWLRFPDFSNKMLMLKFWLKSLISDKLSVFLSYIYLHLLMNEGTELTNIQRCVTYLC